MDKYRALRFIGDGGKVLGFITIVLAVLGALVIVAAPFLAGTAYASSAGPIAAFTLAGGTLFSGVGSGIALIAFGQLIHLLIDLAASSARTAELLEKAMAPAAKTPVTPG